MERLSENVLKVITDKVTENLKVIFGDKISKIVLYGSYARGDAHDFSRRYW